MISEHSATYIYAYIAFAVVYLASAAACAIAAFRISTKLSRCGQHPAAEPVEAAPPALTLRRALRLLDCVQGTALLPIAYVVASAGLGALILRGQPAPVMNTVWILLTAISAGAAVILAVLSTREMTRMSGEEIACGLGDSLARSLHKAGTRLGASAVVLVLVAAFVAVNLVSVISSLETLLKTDFLL